MCWSLQLSLAGLVGVSLFLFVQRSLPVYKVIFFFFNDTATTEIYTLSLHDALPISLVGNLQHARARGSLEHFHGQMAWRADRKSTRLNSSHGYISYAVFCLKKKNDPPGMRCSFTAALSHVPATRCTD